MPKISQFLNTDERFLSAYNVGRQKSLVCIWF